ncbi:MAG: RNA polymerase factor sigma-54, partial [Pseudomonadota bacterium]|nr:RNA polymerase factor sigma-54 [Pseudomonadota bacterium]
QGAHDGSRESSMSATDMMVAPTGLREQLRSQANLLPLSERDHALVCGVIESLDDDGYLRMDLTELGPLMALDPPADESELSTALRLVQSFEPAGVGARHVGECLLLQVDKVDPAWRELSRRIVTSHLELLARRDSVALAAQLGCSVTAAESACQAVRRLDPRPGWTCGHADLPYVTPDVVVRKVRGQWLAQLNPAVRPRVRLNRGCAELFARHREARHAELGAHLQEARWTLRNIEQRFSTIQAVAQAILRRQHMFFDYGPLAMKPLALRDIAREVGVHESTVCRVTNNKYMATPSGLFELKHFFSRAMPMSNGAASTGSAIRSVVQELIEGENPEQPLSDVAITQRLAREGLNVARRTVTKYRQALKIAPAERRRVAFATPG